MWILRNLKVSDHAWFLARGVFPVKTNADEVSKSLICLILEECLQAELAKIIKGQRSE